MFREIILPIFRSTRLCVTACGITHSRCWRPVAVRQTSWLRYTTSCNTQSSVPEDGQNNCPKRFELTWIINIILTSTTGTPKFPLSHRFLQLKHEHVFPLPFTLHPGPILFSIFSPELYWVSSARRMRQICVFNTRLFSLCNKLNYAIHRACLRMVLLTDVYRKLTSLWIKH